MRQSRAESSTTVPGNLNGSGRAECSAAVAGNLNRVAGLDGAEPSTTASSNMNGSIWRIGELHTAAIALRISRQTSGTMRVVTYNPLSVIEFRDLKTRLWNSVASPVSVWLAHSFGFLSNVNIPPGVGKSPDADCFLGALTREVR